MSDDDHNDPPDASERGDRPRVTTDGAAPPVQAPPGDRTFGWRGWVLVAAVLVSFLVIPWVIILLPRAQGALASLGLSLRDAYLTLPLIPAILLASLAVWSALASRREG